MSSILLYSLGSPYRAWVLICYSCDRASAVESISVAQTSHFSTLFRAGVAGVSVKRRHVSMCWEEAADDTGLTVQQVVVSYEDMA